MVRYILVSFFVLFCCKGFAQIDSVQNLNVINLQTIKLQKHSKGYKIQSLSDSVILKNSVSFSSLLRFNTPIYVKEYGAGGTSSASFRGTNASSTAVIWNGININSINNGQSDFNAFSVSLNDNIDVRSGGGSIEFGSGAVGGTIHLNDELAFNKPIENQLIASVGSFETYNSLYKFSFGSDKTAVKFGVSYNQSENDYDWLGYDLKNENGSYNNLSFNLGIAQELTKHSDLRFYSSKYNGHREFSGVLPNPAAANEKYKDFNFRNLLDFNFYKNDFSHTVKLAYLTQEYQYFENKDLDTHNYGKSKEGLVKYIFNYKISSSSNIESYSEFDFVQGSTDQMVARNRNQISQSVIYNKQFGTNVSLNTKIRKDWNSDYKIPFIFALGAEIKLIRNTFFRINGSKNYRVPSYNDLYWPGLGNQNLIPESTLQGEIGVGYKNNLFKIDLGGFYIDSKDKIVWIPGGDPAKPGIWTPVNISEVVNKGLELVANYNENFGNHYFRSTFNYSYTISKDKKTKMFLPFVPKHLLNLNLGYSYKKISVFYQHLFNGEIYTTEDNLENYSVPYFNVGNVGVDYNILKTNKTQLDLGAKINNVFNEAYEVMPNRPMPNRNINININYKF